MGTYGSRLREFRQYKKLSQIEFAELCGVSQANVTQWETDRNKASGNIIKIQKAFPDLNIEWLEIGKGEMLNNKKLFLPEPQPLVNEPEPIYQKPEINEEAIQEILRLYKENARLLKERVSQLELELQRLRNMLQSSKQA